MYIYTAKLKIPEDSVRMLIKFYWLYIKSMRDCLFPVLRWDPRLYHLIVREYYLRVDSFDYYPRKTETRSSVRRERSASKLAYRSEINSSDMQIGKGLRSNERKGRQRPRRGGAFHVATWTDASIGMHRGVDRSDISSMTRRQIDAAIFYVGVVCALTSGMHELFQGRSNARWRLIESKRNGLRSPCYAGDAKHIIA